MANEYYWKVWLRPNLLTKDDDNDYVAEVLTQKDTLHNENIANAIIKEGSEIKYDTLLSIIKQRDRIVREPPHDGLQPTHRGVPVHASYHGPLGRRDGEVRSRYP